MPRPDWYNENSYRSFPFLKGLTGVAVDPLLVLSGPSPGRGLTQLGSAAPGIMGRPYGSSGSSSLLTLANLPEATIVDFGCVIGYASSYDPMIDSVFLYKITRVGSLFTFEFRSSAMSLDGIPLIFTRSLSDPQMSVEYTDSDGLPQSLTSTTSLTGPCPTEPAWTGFIVTGDLTALAAILLSGQTLTGPTGPYLQVEPSTVIDQFQHTAWAINLANDDRTRATGSSGCSDPVWDYPAGTTLVQQTCLQGRVLLMAGFNVIATQIDFANEIQLSASPGVGVVGNCGDLALFPGEKPPTGSALLDGAVGCDQVLTTINGIAGPRIDFHGGAGVTVTSSPSTNTVLINVNMNDVGNVCNRFEGGGTTLITSISSIGVPSISSISTAGPLGCLSNTIQRLDMFQLATLDPAATYRLSLYNHTTSLLHGNSTAATIQAAIQALPNVGVGNCLLLPQNTGDFVNAGSGGFLFFTGALAGEAVPLAQVIGWNGAHPGPVVTMMYPGELANPDDIQLFNFSNPPPGMLFTVTFKGFSTAPIAVVNNVGGPRQGTILQHALESLPSIGLGNVFVQGQNDGDNQPVDGFFVHFMNALGGVRQPLLSINAVPGTQVIMNHLVPACMLKGHIGPTSSSVSLSLRDRDDCLTSSIQRLDLFQLPSTQPTATYFFVLGTHHSAYISASATALEIQNALQAIHGVGLGCCLVYPQNVGDPINDKMGGFIVFTGGLTGLDMPTLEVEGWTGTGTGPVVTSMMTGGLLGIDDVQLFNLVRPAVGTTFTATLNGQTTAAIGAYNNPSGPDQGVALQAALEALPTIGPGNVLVQAQNQTSSHSVDGFYVQFIGSLAQKRQNLLQITPTPSTGVSIVRLTEACFANSSSIAPIPHGLSDTIQIYGPTNFNLQGSHFSMQFVLGGSTSPTVTNVPMTPNALQLILESLPSVGPGNVAVYGQSEYPNQESNIFVIHFTGDLAGTDVPLLQAQSSLPGNSLVAECRVVQHGGMTTSDDFQWVDFRIPTGQPFGNNTITYGGHTTVNIPIGSTGTPTVDGLGPQIRTAMQALSSIGFGNCQIYAGEYPTSSFQFTDGFLARFTGCLSGTPALAITATTYAGPGALITRIVPGFGGSSPDANPVSLYPIAAWPSGAFVSNDVNVTLNRFVSGTLFPSPPADTFDLLGPVGGGSCGVVAANITKTPDAVTSISFSMYYALGCLPTAFISASHVTAVFGVCNYIYTWTISVEVETSPGVYTAIWSVSGIVPPNTNPGVLTYPMTLINPSLNTRPNWQNARLNLSATGTSVPSSTETEVYQAYVKVYY